jgi:putative DNA primase/helicase
MTENQFKAALAHGGINFDAPIIPDDQIHRVKGAGHRTGTKNIAYRFNGKMGWAQDFKTNAFVTWSIHGGKFQLSAAELEQIRQAKEQRQKEIETQQKETAKKAKELFKKGVYADSYNQYCYRKNIQPHGAKTAETGSLKGVLIIPLFDADSGLVNLQFIQPDGTKRFLSGGKKRGCYFDIGKPTDTILIAEGFATGASLFEYYGKYTVIAFDAGNLEPVAKVIRAKHPDSSIILCSDNDETGVGQQKARAAALSVRGLYIEPPIAGMDFNDFINHINSSRETR